MNQDTNLLGCAVPAVVCGWWWVVAYILMCIMALSSLFFFFIKKGVEFKKTRRQNAGQASSGWCRQQHR